MTKTTHHCDQCTKLLDDKTKFQIITANSNTSLEFLADGRSYRTVHNRLEFCDYDCFTQWIAEIPKRLAKEREEF